MVELCHVNADGSILECEMHDYDALPGTARAACDATSDELLFEVATTADETLHLTAAEWQRRCDQDGCEPVPEDVLLKALGPAACAQTSSRFHLHFGAGRLGLGLVVPAVSASGVPFAVVQRPKVRWQQLFRHGARPDQCCVSVNSEVLVQNVDVLAARGGGGVPEAMPPQSLVFGSSHDELASLLARATSFSCSLGGAMEAVLLPLLSALPRAARGAQPLLFACENDHAAVARLKARLAGRVGVVDCMVDRVCTACEISADGVDVSAEPWRGSIVVLDPRLRREAVRVPFCPSVVTVAGCEAEAAYLSERKLELVNGMHTTLAFMTLDARFRPEAAGEELVLLKYSEMGRDARRACEAWRSARVARLIERFGLASIMGWHGLASREAAWEALLTHADHVLVERFSRVDDRVSRVLGGGVAARWRGRLRPVQAWARERDVAASWSDETRAFFAYAARRDARRAAARRGGAAAPEGGPEGDPLAVGLDEVLLRRARALDQSLAGEAELEAKLQAALPLRVPALGTGSGSAEAAAAAAEREGGQAAAAVTAELLALTAAARRFFRHEHAIVHAEPAGPAPPPSPSKVAVRVPAGREPAKTLDEAQDWGL